MTRAIKKRATERRRTVKKPSATRRRSEKTWSIRRVQGVEILESQALAKLGWLAHGFSTRPGGESVLGGKRTLNLGFTDWDKRERVAANRAKFMAAVAAKQMSLATLRQFHSDV